MLDIPPSLYDTSLDYHPTSYQNAVEIHKTLNDIPKSIQDISGSYIFGGLISAHTT